MNKEIRRKLCLMKQPRPHYNSVWFLWFLIDLSRDEYSGISIKRANELENRQKSTSIDLRAIESL